MPEQITSHWSICSGLHWSKDVPGDPRAGGNSFACWAKEWRQVSTSTLVPPNHRSSCTSRCSSCTLHCMLLVRPPAACPALLAALPSRPAGPIQPAGPAPLMLIPSAHRLCRRLACHAPCAAHSLAPLDLPLVPACPAGRSSPRPACPAHSDRPPAACPAPLAVPPRWPHRCPVPLVPSIPLVPPR